MEYRYSNKHKSFIRSLAHDYDGSVAEAAFDKIVDVFYREFELLKKRISELPTEQQERFEI